MLIGLKIKRVWKGFINKLDNLNVSAKDILVGGLIIFLIGLIFGIFTSPKNQNIGCSFGDRNYYGTDEDEDEDDEE